MDNETKQGGTNKWVRLLVVLVIGLIIGYAFGSQKAQAPSDGKEEADETEESADDLTDEEETPIITDVIMQNHLQLGLPEQDVFLASSEDSTMVMRIEGPVANDPVNLSQEVYAGSEPVEHDPFKLGEKPLGPFPKGKALGMVLAEWLAATGSGTYTVEGDEATLDLDFGNLVPNGVYTLWCSRITFPPNVEIVDKPCGADDGSENGITADADGKAHLTLALDPLEPSTEQTKAVIALAYHSDGQTYGSETGEFGLNTHVQLGFLLPVPETAE